MIYDGRRDRDGQWQSKSSFTGEVNYIEVGNEIALASPGKGLHKLRPIISNLKRVNTRMITSDQIFVNCRELDRPTIEQLALLLVEETRDDIGH